ncbi:hypothetical protein B566_EDAN010839 [Ephemera danica]|nr:hypothetical protein B566_EDAN010839 [Ephemera danica]
MALKRKRVAPPQFYDVESNILYPDRREAKKGKFDDLCRICTSPTSTRNELINIFGVYGKNLKLSEMIDKFLPIVTSDLYFYQQRNNAGTQESEMVEMFDGDATSDHLNCEPEVVTADLSGWCLPELSENVSGNEDCTTEFSPGEEDTPSTSRKSATPTKKSVSATVTKRSATVTMTKKSATPTKTKKSPTYTVTKMKSLTTPKTKKSATSNESHNSSMTKSKSASAFRTKMSILATKNKRQKMQQDSDISSSEDEGNEDSDDPDFMVVEYKSKTALVPKTLPLKCEYCATLLKSYSTAENHYEFEHGMQLCTTCFVHYQTVDELNQHYTDQHPEQTSAPKTIYFQCEYCINNFCTKHKFKSHLREKHQVLLCFKCSATFEDQAKFEVHLQSKKHGMVCRICKADFWALDTWKKHLQGHYSYDIVKVAMPTENSTGLPVEISEFSCSIEPQDGQESAQYASKSLPFQCTFCDVSLSEETVAQDHYKIHNMQLCMYCFNDFSTKRELDGHIVDSHTFSCALCPYSIIGHNANALKDHLTTVHADIYFNKNRVYGCGICHMRFGKKWKLKKHMTEVHEKFTCYVCLKCYSDDDSYQKHLEIEDHGHNCKVCNADFNEEQTLVQHVKKHHPDLAAEFKMKEKTTETKFTCQVLVFDSHSDIDAHSLEVHGCNTSWSYQCSECSKYFETVEMLTLHVKTVHEKSIDKFLCDHCGKAYRSKIKLREHVLNIHNGGSLPAVEKVKCDICNILVREKILEKHRKRHTMVRDIVCGDCGKKFVDTRGLKLHMKTIHRDYNPSIEECPHCRLSLEKIKMKKHIEEEHTAEWSYICNELRDLQIMDTLPLPYTNYHQTDPEEEREKSIIRQKIFQKLDNPLYKPQFATLTQQFSAATTNEDKMKIVAKYYSVLGPENYVEQCFKEVKDKPNFKCREKSEMFRTEGNAVYRNGDHGKALRLYTKSIAYAPLDSSELSLAYANRSAVLRTMKKYRECLVDIQRALNHGYLINNGFKLVLREMQCHRDLANGMEMAASYEKASKLLSGGRFDDC